MNKKIERFLSRLEEDTGGEGGVDGYLLLNLESSDRTNQRYLTGFDSSLGVTLITPDRVYFLTDSRYIEAAREALDWVELEEISSKPIETAVELVNGLDLEQVALDQNDVSLGLYNELEEKLEPEIVQLDGTIRQVRRKKEEEELELHQRAADIADEAFTYLLDFVRPGRTEKEIALELEYFMRQNGAESVSFPPIVATGERSALPHAHPEDTELSPDQLVLVDMGARYEGYCSDMTRTFYLGDPTDKVEEIYRIVLEAQRTGLEELGPGVSTREVHERASQVIETAGYGDYFKHGLGHGVGLEIHEGPRLNETSDATLEPGMVVTVEPGIYLPGWGGIRIEDMVRITDSGYSRFSRSRKEEIINPLEP